MAFKFHSNRRLHDKNTKAVPIAIDRIKTVAPIVQERYHNSFEVNGFPCVVYNKMHTGVKCSCSTGREVSPILPLLDDKGNAAPDHIQSMLTGSDYGVDDYGVTLSQTSRDDIFTIDSNNTKKKSFQPEHDSGNPFATDIESDINSTFLELEASRATTGKCGICFGTGYVGGFNVHNGMRMVLSSVSDAVLYGYTVDQTATPHSFSQNDPDGYVDFTITLPFGATKVDALNVWNNQTALSDVRFLIGPSSTGLVPLTKASLLTFCTGVPVLIRVEGCKEFTHIEIQFNLTNDTTYLEYPHFTKTGDLNVIDAVSNIQILVSPKVYQVQPWDIIVDLHDRTAPKYWRVLDNTDFKDRNSNVHGWEVNARLVQGYEIYRNLPLRQQTGQGQDLTTRLPRF